MDDTLQRKGGTEPNSFPHQCVFSVPGVDKATCAALSSIYLRNMDGCCGNTELHFSPCNSSIRKCRECIKKGRRGPEAKTVRDVRSGLCDEHIAIGMALPHSAQRVQAPRDIVTALRRPPESRGSDPMRQLSKEERGRIARLPPGEAFVLERIAYGDPDDMIEQKLARLQNGASGPVRGLGDVARSLYRALDLGGLESDKLRRQAAGKLFFAYRDAELDGAGPVEDDESHNGTADEDEEDDGEPVHDDVTGMPGGNTPRLADADPPPAASRSEASDGGAGGTEGAQEADTPDLEASVARIASFTPHKLAIFAAMAEGLKNPEIAGRLGTSITVVQNQAHAIYEALGLAALSKGEKRRVAIAAYRKYSGSLEHPSEAERRDGVPALIPSVPEINQPPPHPDQAREANREVPVPEARPHPQEAAGNGAGTVAFLTDPYSLEDVRVTSSPCCPEEGFRLEGVVVYPTLASGEVPTQYIFVKRGSRGSVRTA